ncbi:MAG: hypothetical protein SFV24_00570 [Gemmatimonadales bacterium]|nr:hypothetical protein [Gemmatimonadales bacterium]
MTRIDQVLALTIALSQGKAQPPQSIPPDPACKPCKITLAAPKAVVGGMPHGLDRLPTDLAEDHRGRFVIMYPREGQLPTVTDSVGRPLIAIGHAGSGPGEYRRPTLIAMDRDTAFIFDAYNARISVLGPDYKFVRQGTAPLHTLGMEASADGLILNALIRDRDRIGLALHRFDRALRPSTSFDNAATPIEPGNPWDAIRRSFTRDRIGNTVSVTVTGGYRFRIFSREGTLLDERVRQADWLTVPPKSADGVPGPPPWLRAVRQDSLGRIWVVAAVADPRWRRGLVVRKVASGRESGWEFVSMNPAQYQDTILEVFDLTSWRLVTSRRFDQSCRGFTKAGDLMCDEENQDGSYRIEIRPVRID